MLVEVPGNAPTGVKAEPLLLVKDDPPVGLKGEVPVEVLAEVLAVSWLKSIG